MLEAEGAHLAPAQARATLVESAEDVARTGHAARVEQLFHAIDMGDLAVSRAYIDQHGVAGVARFHAGEKTRIYCLEVETFPHHVNNVYLVLEPGTSVMFDCGSGFDSSTRDLDLCFAIVRAVFGEQGDVCGARLVRHLSCPLRPLRRREARQGETRARLAVHELDARVLSCFDERIVVASKDCDVFWRRAGVPDDERASLLEMYAVTKRFFRSARSIARSATATRSAPDTACTTCPATARG